MNRITIAALLLALPLAAAAQMKVVSDTKVEGFKFPESVGCDAKNKLLYIGNFGSKLAPKEKDAAGYISKVSLDGKVLEEHFLPAPGVTMDKPKGIWVRGSRLWTTDIDAVWVFDLKTKKGRKLALPGAQFANDPAIYKGALYVTDNGGDQLFKVEPADFLNIKGEPKVTVVFKDAKVNPNGIWPAHGGLVVVGFVAPDQPRAIFSVGKDGKTTALSDPIGRLDGVAELKDRSLLVTDWNTGSLFQWSKMGVHKLADGFKGPADFCAIQHGKGVTVYAPDLVQSHVRIIELR
jgi:hypothetical protein